MRPARALAALMVLAALGGCIGSPQDVEPAALPSLDDVSATAHAALASLLADVPCDAAEVADGTTENIRELALLPYTAFSEPVAHGEIDVRGAWMLVARYGGGGFEIVNVADPANPVHVAVYEPEGETAFDVKWMPDNRSAIVAHEMTIELVDLGPVLDAALPPEELAEANLTGRLVATWEHPAPQVPMPVTNMHMVFAKRIGDTDYVFIAPNDDTGVWILRIVGEGDNRTFEYVTNVAFPLGGGPLGPHDMWVGDDEILGVPILYVSNGFEGWKAYDLSDPASPRLLGLMPNLVGQGYTHSIMAMKVGDRRLLATVAEVGVNTLRVWDITNFQAPLLLGEWWADRTNPTKMQHNLQIVGDRLYVAHYAEGVFVFELGNLTMPLLGTLDLVPVARYAPAQANIWDVVVSNGLLYVNDIGQGTAVVGYGCLVPGDAAQTSTG